MEVTAYQTLEDKDNIDYVENYGPFKCTRNDAWLGYGYYFWDTDIDWAVKWGEKSYKRKGKNYIIAECQLELDDNSFDLVGKVADQIAFRESAEVFIHHDVTEGEHETLTVPNLIAYMKKEEIFPYNAIRANDFTNPFKIYFKGQNGEYLIINPRIQICVISLNQVFSQPFKVIYPN